MGSGEASEHQPVLKAELVEFLDLSQSDTVIDATFGFGGHAEAVLEKLGSAGRLVGFERDPQVVGRIPSQFREDDRVEIVNESYTSLKRHLGSTSPDAIYFDVGICSYHLETAERGFSFQDRGEPFDCRFNPNGDRPPAWKLVNESSPDRLRQILQEFGEVRFLGPVVEELLERRPVETVGDVVAAVEEVVYPHNLNGELARVFQAFRIAVNRELEELRQGLEIALEQLASSGRMVVISFHSLEDRIVKHFFRDAARECICPPELPVCACDKEKTCEVVTKSPIRPSEEEIEANSRASSAKLRTVKKV